MRPPAVAGFFYPAADLDSAINGMFRTGPGPVPSQPSSTIAVVAPHAGYQYSGVVAAHSYHAISGNKYPYAVMVGPDHRGIGQGVCLSGHKYWETPLGTSPLYDPTPMEECGATYDIKAHAPEHSLEVQLPIIQYVMGYIPILPVLLSDQSRHTATQLGRCMAKMLGPDSPAMIASSDLTHYAPDDIARKQDGYAIDAMLDLDIQRFYDVLRERHVTACGYGAIAAIMQYSIEMGASGGRLLSYMTSGDAGAGRDSVVGYCAISYS